ncbi:hypothetical protein G6F50_014447 [Rhizopus delemar]|uniref:DNA binding HTH domain-containing protein n=1 Tax=Rhizopus delemar TaxID=936053 RepID=A0A9P6Y5G3_9FUNG|nr:hypothetical protein G6F50_014447 [Rhizopus delemar]
MSLHHSTLGLLRAGTGPPASASVRADRPEAGQRFGPGPDPATARPARRHEDPAGDRLRQHRYRGGSIKLGADDYLPKPATVPMILRALGEEDDGPADDGEMEVPDAMTPISRLQWEHIQQAMHETGGNVSAAARLLGMHRRSLQRKLAKRPSPERDPTR